ncbi:MAG: hypothetical protein AAF798_08465 [Bacteroidota bacterium]
MATNDNLHSLFRRWRWQKTVALVLLVLAVGLPLYAGVSMLWPGFEWGIVGLGMVVFGLLAKRIWSTSPKAIGSYLNTAYPSLEQSADLLLCDPAELSNLQQLQQAKVQAELRRLSIHLPHQLPQGGLALALGIGLFVFLQSFNQPAPESELQQKLHFSPQTPTPERLAKAIPPALESASIRVQPAAYTRKTAFQTEDPDLDVPYWSAIAWELAFTSEVQQVALVLADGEKVLAKSFAERQSSKQWQLTYRAQKSSFYSLAFVGADGQAYQTDYFKLQVQDDQAPELEVLGLAPYTELVFTPEKVVPFRAIVQDDYGITDARLVATLTKGEGEAVQFKNDTLRFDANFTRQQKTYQLEYPLHLTQLGMEPGDELYIHLEASDNRQPSSLISKTAKYIIAFEDTTALSADMYGKMAVDRMPEYFRSQRQIIIDTEKLIAKRDQLPRDTYWLRSNSIAADQKLLRLRYGQFLGEEFETVIGPHSALPGAKKQVKTDTTKELPKITDLKALIRKLRLPRGHENETPEEHAAHAQKELPKGHEHETWEEHAAHSHGEQLPEELIIQENDVEAMTQKSLEPFAHIHDIAEETTYFDAATATKLRAALSQMWDAELHLRMGRPEQALPYEYKALELIKEVQQASRVYVERVGFEPPVIKVAEKRLSGELSAIQSTTFRTQASLASDYKAIAQAIPALERIRQDGHFSASDQLLLQQSGEELAAIVLRQDGRYWKELKLLRELMDGQLADAATSEHATKLLECFWKIVPASTTPIRQQEEGGKLSDLFFEALEQSDR